MGSTTKTGGTFVKLKPLGVGGCVVALSTAILSGCGTTATSQPITSGAFTNASTNSTAAAGGDKQLVMYSAEGFDQTLADSFQKKTGIQVKLIDDSTGNLLAKMQAEKANPQWDITWFDGASSMQGLDDQGMLLKGYTPSNAANYSDLGKQLQSKDQSYYPVTVTAAGVIAYNTDQVKDTSTLPKDWSDLLKPQYKGTFAMNNPSISGPTYPAVLGLMQLQGGIPQGEDFFKQLKANGLQVFDSNGPTITNLIQGNVKYVIAQDSALIDKISKNNPIKIIYPTSGVTTLSSNIGIDSKAPHPDAAKQFVDYVLSQEAQNIATASDGGDSNFAPIINGVTGKTGIRPDGIKWNLLDATFGAQHENEVKQWFTDNIVQK
ncbi:MAG: hypothetical protein JWN30_2547 [Bacilli bacterium]|nr:hypothetical protein [Bacilli bacterium]